MTPAVLTGVADLAELSDAASFALLGPGYGGGPFLLLDTLEEIRVGSSEYEDASGREPLLVFVPFELPGCAARIFRPRRVRPVDLEWGAQAAGLPLVEIGAPGGSAGVDVGALTHAAAPASWVPGCAGPAELAAPDYAAVVERIRCAIAAGDVYQVCYTVRARLGPLPGAALLGLLCAGGVPRHAAWVRLPGGPEIVSASPELFFSTRGRRVRAEPMKGTARLDAAGLLVTSEKEASELAMITDLLRNDLTPVCVPRSVRVACARRLVRLPYAWQCVSDVVGLLQPQCTPLDVLSALHPGGSVTGAPKAAALTMIHQLEAGPRGAYCGALGLLSGERSVFGLLIRTAERTDGGWVYGVGSGIVWDSDAEAELAELRLKLEALAWRTRS